MNRIVSIIAASALISAALVGGLAAANGSRNAATAAWTNPPAVDAGCRADCAAAMPARRVRVIAIDGRAWPAGEEAAERAARKTASR